MTATLSQMRSKLLTLDQVKNKLATTEPLGHTFIEKGTSVKFNVKDNWHQNVDFIGDDDPVDAFITVGDKEYQLTLKALQTAGSNFGLSAAYAKKLSERGAVSSLNEQLNWWYKDGLGDEEFKLVILGDDQLASGFTRPAMSHFSNLEILAAAEKVIDGRYADDEILVDYKFHHSVDSTAIRLILPGFMREIEGTSTENDLWSAGLSIANSLTGKNPTQVEAYLFRWVCTNGMTKTNAETGRWSRRQVGGQDEESVYKWAQESVDEILGGMEGAFDKVQHLANTPLGTNTKDVLQEVFKKYKVPVSQRQGIIDALLAEGELTMYSVVQAITRQANDPNINPDRIDTIMRIGGNLADDQFDTRVAQAWNEGKTAPEGAPNPYLITSQ